MSQTNCTQKRGAAYLENVTGKLDAIESRQADNFRKAGEMIADAVQQDRLVHVYGGGGHTVMMLVEMFFRAGGLANVNPIMGHDISPFCQALDLQLTHPIFGNLNKQNKDKRD